MQRHSTLHRTDLKQLIPSLIQWAAAQEPRKRVYAQPQGATAILLFARDGLGPIGCGRDTLPSWQHTGSAATVCFLSALLNRVQDDPHLACQRQGALVVHDLTWLAMGQPLCQGITADELRCGLHSLNRWLEQQPQAVYLDQSVEMEVTPVAVQAHAHAPVLDDVLRSANDHPTAKLMHDALCQHLQVQGDDAEHTVQDFASLTQLLDDDLRAPSHALDLGKVDIDLLGEFERMGLWTLYLGHRQALKPPLTALALPPSLDGVPDYLAASLPQLTEITLPDYQGPPSDVGAFSGLWRVVIAGQSAERSPGELGLPPGGALVQTIDMDLSD